MPTNMPWWYVHECQSSLVHQLIRYSFRLLQWSQAGKSLATPNVRLGGILLPRRRRYKKLLRQRKGTESHNYVQRYPPVTNSNCNQSCCRSRRNRSLYRNPLRSHYHTNRPCVRQREARDCNSRRYHRRCIQHADSGPVCYCLLDVQEGEEAAQAKGTLRRAVLADQCVSKGVGFERRVLQRQCAPGRAKTEV